jgi:hypothetical protein
MMGNPCSYQTTRNELTYYCEGFRAIVSRMIIYVGVSHGLAIYLKINEFEISDT